MKTFSCRCRRFLPLALSLAMAGMLSACVSNPSLDKARDQIVSGDTESALVTLQKAMKADPGNQEYRTLYLRERDRLIARRLLEAEAAREGGRWQEAEADYDRALALDPANARALTGKGRIGMDRRHEVLLREARAALGKGDVASARSRLETVLESDPSQPEAGRLMRGIEERAARGESDAPVLKSALGQNITLEFKDASLKSVFEVIARTAGINFVFDREVHGETPVTLFVKNTRIEEVIKLLLITNQLGQKVLNENTVLIYPNTPVKQKDYQDMVVRSFYLKNAEVKQAMALVKTMVKTRDVFADEKLNLLVMRDTPDAVRMAERLVANLDLAEPEVMLEVEVLEVARNKLKNLGLQWPDQIGYGRLTQDIVNTTVTTTGSGTTTTLGGALASGYTNLKSSLGVPFVANPAFMLNLHDGLDSADILANPRIRVQNREKAKIHIGERLPVFTTTSTANVGVSASVNYLDVGLKLDVQPTITLDDDVSIKVGLEVSSVLKEVLGPQSALAYQVGTRTAATTLMLKDGETQVLAGLINDEERSSAAGLPGLGQMPVVGKLFGSEKNSHTKTEIVLLITPHVVRNISLPSPGAMRFPGGTDSSVGAPPITLGSAQVSMRSGGGASASVSSGAAPVPFVPPETGSPRPLVRAGVSSPDVAAAAGVQARLDIPEHVAPGQGVTVAVVVSGMPGAQGGRAEVAYDPTAVEVPGGAADGRLIIGLSQQADGSLRGEGTVRILPGSGKEVAFQVVGIGVDDGSGDMKPVTPPPPRLVKIGP